MNDLTAHYDRATRILVALTATCKLMFCWSCMEHKKPFNDGGFYEECMNVVTETPLRANKNTRYVNEKK